MKYMVTSSLFTTILYKKLPDYHFVTLEVCLSFQGTWPLDHWFPWYPTRLYRSTSLSSWTDFKLTLKFEADLLCIKKLNVKHKGTDSPAEIGVFLVWRSYECHRYTRSYLKEKVNWNRVDKKNAIHYINLMFPTAVCLVGTVRAMLNPVT